MPCGRCWLGNSLTGEAVLLPGRGRWLLSFSKAAATRGQGFVRPLSGVGEPQWCSELFRYAVYASAAGELRTLDRQALGRSDTQPSLWVVGFGRGLQAGIALPWLPPGLRHGVVPASRRAEERGEVSVRARRGGQ